MSLGPIFLIFGQETTSYNVRTVILYTVKLQLDPSARSAETLATDGTAKIFLIIATRRVLWRSIQAIQSGVFRPNIERGGKEEFVLVNKALKMCTMQGNLFYTFVFIIIGIRALYAVVDTGTVIEFFEESSNLTLSKRQRTLPYVTWFPFDSYESPRYEYVFAFQIFCTVVYGFYIGGIDALICGFLMVLKSQFLILKRSLETIVERSGIHVKKRFGQDVAVYNNNIIKLPGGFEKINVLSDKTQKIVEELTAEAARHHQELVEFCAEVEDVFCYLLLMQFLSSLLIICFQLFQISMTEPSSFSFFSMVCYLILMMFQILMYCWHGNEVKLVSERVNDYIFNIDWIVMNNNAKKYLLMMMMRSQRPCYFTAGKFTLLSLETYMSIIRGSGSYFMFLRQMNN